MGTTLNTSVWNELWILDTETRPPRKFDRVTYTPETPCSLLY